MSVYGFTLVTGEILLTQVKDRTDSEITLKDPAIMVVHELEPGRSGVALQPFVPFGTNIKLKHSAIVAEYELDQQIENEYNRLFGTIQIATASDISQVLNIR